MCRLLSRSRSISSGILFRSRFPLVFIILCCVVNLPTQGELIFNPIASALYFTVGFSLHGNPHLFNFLKAHWRYYLLGGLASLISYMILEFMNLVTDKYSTNIAGDKYLRTVSKSFTVLSVFLKTVCAILFSYAFIGLSERKFSSYSPRLRFISDGAYWMYLIHLPIVALITFFMFNLHLPVEIKFFIAVVITSIIGLATYNYLVRSTIVGMLLNGKRIS